MTSAALFRGTDSLRLRGETARLILTLALLPLTLGVIGFFIHQSFDIHSVALIVVAAMVYVALGRGRFLGAGVRIHENQFGHVHEIVSECAARLGMTAPAVFLRDDIFTPVVSLGLGEPYALVMSAQWIELFNEHELRFAVGRELAHIRSGHTRITSLLSTNGRENPVVAFAFGPWLRATEYTADRVGLLLGGSVETAISAMAITTFGHVGRRIDIRSFTEQRRELDAEPALRMGEWLAPAPYITNRIARLAAFARTPLYATWAERLQTPLAPDEIAGRRIYAGPWRRAVAFGFDIALISALLPTIIANGPGAADAPINVTTPTGSTVVKRPHLKVGGKPVSVAPIAVTIDQSDLAEIKKSDAPPAVKSLLVSTLGNVSAIELAASQVAMWLIFLAYLIVLVGIGGQTFGMMICDLRVVDAQFRKVGFGQVVARYLVFLVSLPMIVGAASLFRRVQPFEKWTKTRLVSGNVRPAMPEGA